MVLLTSMCNVLFLFYFFVFFLSQGKKSFDKTHLLSKPSIIEKKKHNNRKMVLSHFIIISYPSFLYFPNPLKESSGKFFIFPPRLVAPLRRTIALSVTKSVYQKTFSDPRNQKKAKRSLKY